MQNKKDVLFCTQYFQSSGDDFTCFFCLLSATMGACRVPCTGISIRGNGDAHDCDFLYHLDCHTDYVFCFLALYAANRERCIRRLTKHGMLAKDVDKSKAVLLQPAVHIAMR